MASAKSQGLLAPLIVSIVITVAMIVTSVMLYQEKNKLDSELAGAKRAKQDADGAMSKALTQVGTLKQRLGYPDAEFGNDNDAAGGTSLMAMVAKDLDTYADANNKTYSAALIRLNGMLEDTRKELLAKTADYDTLKGDYEKQRATEAQRIAETVAAFDAAKADLTNEQAKFGANLQGKDQEFLALQDRANEIAEREKETSQKFEEYQKDKESELTTVTTALREARESVERSLTVGKPVGSVVHVQHDSFNKQTYAYVDLGEADRLPLQTTFSIWAPDKIPTPYWKEKEADTKTKADDLFKESNKKTNLAPRTEGGPKGYVEIVAIVGPHQSIGRVTLSTSHDPISPGDRLLSPLWSPGAPKHIALVGRFDMTGKGTNDRALLVQLIKQQGGIIDVEVKDDGTIDTFGGPGLSPSTHWLVVGTLPDPTDTSDPEAKQYGPLIATAAGDLQADAKKLAVEIMDQYKLYDYMGYRVHSRQYELGSYTGGPEPANRYENPTISSRPTGLPSAQEGASTRPTGLPGKQNYDRK